MKRPKIGVTASLPPPALEIMSEYCDIETPPRKGPLGRDALLELVKDKDGLVCTVSDKVDAKVMASAPNLRIISTYSVGYDHVDIKAATERSIYVTNTPGVLTETTADLAWALLMSIARRVPEADRHVRAGKWKIAWEPGFMVGDDIHGRTLGIIGFGRIGSAIARRAAGFKMKLLYYDVIRPSHDLEKELDLEYSSLESVLKESDFITLHVALTDKTHHLINENSLRMMKPTAYLINASRGPVVDQVALAKALKEGWIAGAGIDVYEKEPIDPDDPLLQLENVILAPHIGSATKHARSKMGEVAARNLVAVLKGEEPISLVNKRVTETKPLYDVRLI